MSIEVLEAGEEHQQAIFNMGRTPRNKPLGR
jgi:hypothetical protein